MKRFFMILLICAFSLTVEGQELSILQKAFQQAAKKASPSVIHLAIEATPASSFNPTGRGSGNLATVASRTVSGLAVEKDYVLTDASHLVGKVNKVEVVLPSGQRYSAKVLGKDFRYNLALLKVEGANLTPVQWGDSKKLKVGQFVVVVGKAYNSKSPSVSSGMLSALNRFGGRAIQTDASVSPAYTGGALVDIEGNAIGIAVTLSSRVGVNSGIGFAIPSHLIQKSIKALKSKKIIRPAFLGVSFPTEGKGGVTIQSVVKNTAAEKAGLKIGDKIIEVNGTKVQGAMHFRKILMDKLAGDEINLKFIREGKTITIKLELGERPRGI